MASVGFSYPEPKGPNDKRTGPTLAMVIDPPRVDSGLWASATNMHPEGQTRYS